MSEKKYPERDKSWWGHKRDDIAFHIAVFTFKHLATKWYAAMIEGSIRLGLDAARQEAKVSEPTISLAWLQDQAERSDTAAEVRSTANETRETK